MRMDTRFRCACNFIAYYAVGAWAVVSLMQAYEPGGPIARLTLGVLAICGCLVSAFSGWLWKPGREIRACPDGVNGFVQIELLALTVALMGLLFYQLVAH